MGVGHGTWLLGVGLLVCCCSVLLGIAARVVAVPYSVPVGLVSIASGALCLMAWAIDSLRRTLVFAAIAAAQVLVWFSMGLPPSSMDVFGMDRLLLAAPWAWVFLGIVGVLLGTGVAVADRLWALGRRSDDRRQMMDACDDGQAS